MTVIDVIVLGLFFVQAAHVLIRRFQDRFRSFWIHLGLFFITCWFFAAFAAGESAWLTVPSIAVLTLVSQVAYMRDSRGPSPR